MAVPSDTAKLVERLRFCASERGNPYPLEMREAADAVERLTAERDEARARAESVQWGDISPLISAEADRDRLAAALRRIEENALAWHGPEPPGSGHVRALTVIAQWCCDALAAAAGKAET